MKKETNYVMMATVVFATSVVVAATRRNDDGGGDDEVEVPSTFFTTLLGASSPEEALQRYGWTLVAIIVASIGGLLSLGMLSSKHKKKDRSWSFTSRAMGLGSFPRKVEFHEPIINAVLVFETTNLPATDDILKSVKELTTKYDRFGQVYDPIKDQIIGTQKDFDVSDLVRVVEFDSSAMAAGNNSEDNTDTILMKVMEDHALDPLSRDPRGKMLPWWEFLILKDIASPPQSLMPWSKSANKSKSAVVWRVHHAIGDGISLVNVVQDIFVDTSGQKLSDLLPKNLSHKLNKKRSAIDWITQFISSTVTALGVPTSKFDDNTLFYSRPETPSQMSYPKKFGIYSFEPIPLHFVKHLKKAACTKLAKSDSKSETVITINDILFSVTAQAIHDYLQSNNDPALANYAASNKEDFQFRALLPVAIPRPARTHPLRNLWCFVSVDLSVGVDGILQRLACIHETMSGLKNSLVPAVMMGLQNYVLPLLPLWFNRDQVVQIFSRHSVVASNVPGPPIQCVFANQPVQAVHMVHCNLIPQLSFLSYHGMVYGNFTMGVNDGGEGGENHGQRQRDEVLPMYISRAFVDLANKLDESDVIPSTIRDHASRLK